MTKSKQEAAAKAKEREEFLDLISQETYENLMMAAADLTLSHGRRGAAEAISAIAVGLRHDMTLRQLDDDMLLAWRFLSPEAERIMQEREEEQRLVRELKLKNPQNAKETTK